jgi:hypothetical protein
MKIKVSKDFYVNSNTLFRIEWRKYYPILVVHKKMKSVIKWTFKNHGNLKIIKWN